MPWEAMAKLDGKQHVLSTSKLTSHDGSLWSVAATLTMKRLEAGSDGVDIDRIWFFVASRYGGAAAGGDSGADVVKRVVFAVRAPCSRERDRIRAIYRGWQ